MRIIFDVSSSIGFILFWRQNAFITRRNGIAMNNNQNVGITTRTCMIMYDTAIIVQSDLVACIHNTSINII